MRFTKQVSTHRASHRARGTLLHTFVVCLLLALSGATTSAQAQSSGNSDWDESPSEARCVPSCRTGYECRRGECLPVCNPPCGSGYLCSAGGSCVRTEAPPPIMSTPPPQGWGASSNQCLPSCRQGFVCISGQCVTACNPHCPQGYTCTQHGECVLGNEPISSGPSAPPEEEAVSSSADSIVNFHFDAAGLLQFGITPTIEVGKRFSGYLRLRPLNTGLTSYFALAPKDGDEFVWGLGVALGMHVFSAKGGNMRGVFGGPGLEYAYTKMENRKRDYASYGTHVLIPQLDLGYRWVWDSFLLGLGGRIGLSIPVGASDEAIDTRTMEGCRRADSCDEKRKLYFVAGVFLDIGWFF